MKKEIKELAEFMHNEYESYAKKVGWKTQKDCQTLFDELPPANKEVMLWVAKSVNDKLRQQEQLSKMLVSIYQCILAWDNDDGKMAEANEKTPEDILAEIIDKAKEEGRQEILNRYKCQKK